MKHFWQKYLWVLVLTTSSGHLFSQNKVFENQVFSDLPSTAVVVGAARLDTLLPLLLDKQVGLVVNHSSLIGPTHLVDTLFAAGVCVTRIFSPEHGFRGQAEAGQSIRDGEDVRTGIPIVSLYGKKVKPQTADLANVEVVIFDLQDVGVRFYTYISTLLHVLEACAEQGKTVIILDRPNPNGHYVDGPALDMRWESFIGIAPLPIVHGCTVGELARLFAGEHWIRQPQPLRLIVIPCENYTHRTSYDLPVRPSPNLPDTRSVLLYPSICLFEGTVASLGRGTPWPFQIIGHPDYPHGSFAFVPQPNAGSLHPPLAQKLCRGIDLRTVSLDSLRAAKQLNLNYLLDFYREFPQKESFFLQNKFFDLLAGSNTLKAQIIDGCSEAEIRASWQSDLVAYREIRGKYLLYPE